MTLSDQQILINDDDQEKADILRRASRGILPRNGLISPGHDANHETGIPTDDLYKHKYTVLKAYAAL